MSNIAVVPYFFSSFVVGCKPMLGLLHRTANQMSQREWVHKPPLQEVSARLHRGRTLKTFVELKMLFFPVEPRTQFFRFIFLSRSSALATF